MNVNVIELYIVQDLLGILYYFTTKATAVFAAAFQFYPFVFALT